jgi:hypothetical protein
MHHLYRLYDDSLNRKRALLHLVTIIYFHEKHFQKWFVIPCARCWKRILLKILTRR